MVSKSFDFAQDSELVELSNHQSNSYNDPNPLVRHGFILNGFTVNGRLVRDEEAIGNERGVRYQRNQSNPYIC